MQNSSVSRRAFLYLQRVVTAGLFGLLLAGYLCTAAAAQTTVLLAPLPQLQFFDQSGRPLAFGCVFTYENNSTTPLATFTDYTGATQNTNPVILSAGGSANIWIQAGVSYAFRVKSAGGSNCFSGSTLYTVNGIGGGVSTLTTVVPYSPTPVFTDAAQNQLFEITLTGNASSQPLTAVGVIPPGLITWEITQDASGGHTFSWPANVIGGCTIGSLANQVTTQFFIWNGTNATATGPCVTGNGPSVNFGDAMAASLTHACGNPAAAGFIRLCSLDFINWRNVANSADYGIGSDSGDHGVWSFTNGMLLTGAAPNILFGGSTASFPALKQNGTALNVRLADDSADAPLTASTLGLSDVLTSTSTTYVGLLPEVTTPATPPAAATEQLYTKAGKGACTQDSSSVEYCMTTSNAAVQSSIIATRSTDLAVSQNVATTFLSQAVTMPANGCPCRVLGSYGAYTDDGGSSGIATAWLKDGTNDFATAQVLNNDAGSVGPGVSSSSMSPVTYANGASVTFTAIINMTNSGGGTVKASPAAGLQKTWMSLSVFTSN